MRVLLPIMFVLLPVVAMAQVKRTNPPTLSTPTGYTHVVEVTGPAKTVYIAGQIAFDKEGKVVGAGDMAAQAEQVFKNLQSALEAAGAKFSDVVKMNTYIVNYTPEVRPALTAARAKAFGDGPVPASTLIGVQALALPAFMIEIEVVASLQG